MARPPSLHFFIMNYLTFREKLRQLNPNLKIGPGKSQAIIHSEKYKSIGLYLSGTKEVKFLSAIPWGEVKPWSTQDPSQRILSKGFVPVLELLVKKGLVDRRKAERSFATRLFLYAANNRPKYQADLGLERI